MIPANLHFKDSGTVRAKLPAPPHDGHYLRHDGRLYRVDAVVLSTPNATWGQSVFDVYVRGVGDSVTAELEGKWAEWNDNDVSANCSKKKINQGA